MGSETILITGACGAVGQDLFSVLASDQASHQIILTDVVESPNLQERIRQENSRFLFEKCDLTNPAVVNNLFTTRLGKPTVIYSLHGVMSRGAEKNFDMGMKVNVDSVRVLLDAARWCGQAEHIKIKFIFASSLAVYGGDLPKVILPSTQTTPQSSYGSEKLISELLVNEYTRRGFVSGLVLRLPTVVVRAGPPAPATSSFLSSMIRESLDGKETTCPIGKSLDSPELDLGVWLSSPKAVVENFALAITILDKPQFKPGPRTVCLPGFTATIREELEALRKVGGDKALGLIQFQDDPTNRKIVSSWPSKFDNSYALELGFQVDAGGIDEVVQQYADRLR